MSASTPPAAIPAALGWRLLALVYDGFPVLALWFATAAVVLLLRAGYPVAPGSLAAALEFSAMLAVTFGYFGLSWRRGGQTLGMRAWRLRLMRDDGGTPAWSALALRFGFAALSVGVLGLGFFWAMFDRERRTWHDLVSRTVVVRLARR